jgi:glycosyltransferase involved in cell wall biosynthesis
VTDKIPYLLEAGIQPIVLSAVTGRKDIRFPHYQLLPWGPSGLRFDFRHWFAVQFGKKLPYKIITPLVSLLLAPFTVLEKLFFRLSSQASWSLPAAFKGIRLVKSGQVDLIYSSGGAWSAHYAAWLIKKVTKVTWIAEIHDPMIARADALDDGTRPQKTREKRFTQRLEGKICRDADHVWWFTEQALHYAKQRHPELGDKGFVVYPGAEPPGCHQPLPPYEYQERLSIAHFGSLADNRSLTPLLEAMAIFFNHTPEARDKIKIDVYGAGLDSFSKNTLEQLNLKPSVIAHGRIENDEKTGKSGREIIMDKMRLADVLLLLHGNYEECAEYYPSKLYDYYWTDRPILALTHRSPDLDAILAKRQAYLAHTLDQGSILKALKEIWNDWASKQLHQQVFEPISPKVAVANILARIK